MDPHMSFLTASEHYLAFISIFFVRVPVHFTDFLKKDLYFFYPRQEIFSYCA